MEGLQGHAFVLGALQDAIQREGTVMSCEGQCCAVVCKCLKMPVLPPVGLLLYYCGEATMTVRAGRRALRRNRNAVDPTGVVFCFRQNQPGASDAVQQAHRYLLNERPREPVIVTRQHLAVGFSSSILGQIDDCPIQEKTGALPKAATVRDEGVWGSRPEPREESDKRAETGKTVSLRVPCTRENGKLQE